MLAFHEYTAVETILYRFAFYLGCVSLYHAELGVCPPGLFAYNI